MAESLAEVLKAGRWEKALFTTYSLSLTFFETIILRALRSAQCNEIWVVADADGYRTSLMERGSTGVGYEYRLIPIGLRNGVFHPKCCYLAGPDGDLLLIGSGNLTFGGFGRNLEVLETLSSQRHAQCFHEFAEFLIALQSRTDVVCPDFEWADTFAARALEARSSSEVADYPKLLTSTTSSIRTQIAAELESLGEVKHLTILSPFFDPDAKAVQQLATETKVSEVRIALPLGSEESAFPFPKTKKWPLKVSAVTLRGEADNRRLHAKWMEWKSTAGTLTLTGSVNATAQALSGTNNIEVGVLRLAPASERWAEWESAPSPTTFRVIRFERSGIGSSYLVFAELLDNGDVRGRIVSISSPTGVWSGEIQRANGDVIQFLVRVEEGGNFLCPHLTADEDFLFASGLQIKLESGDRLARGWITNITILNLPKSHRISASSLLRLINREETEEDDAALLEYLAMYALDHLSVFQTRVTTPKSGPSKLEEETDHYAIELESLKPDATVSDHQSIANDPIISSAFALQRVFAQLRRRLLGHVSKKETVLSPPVPGSGAGSGEVEEPDDSPEVIQSAERFEDAFEYFMDSMEDLARNSAPSAEHRRAVLVIWVEVALHMLVRRKRDRSGARAFLLKWFWLATTLTSVREQGDSIEQHIVTTAAILSATDSEPEPTLQLLHEGLEHFWQGSVDRERALAELLPPSPLSIAQLFLESSKFTVAEGLTGVLDTTTLRSELEKLLVGAEPLSEDSPLLRSEAGTQLRDELRTRGSKANIEFLGRLLVCPRDFVTLSEACKGELQRNRVARCSVCDRLILRRDP